MASGSRLNATPQHRLTVLKNVQRFGLSAKALLRRVSSGERRSELHQVCSGVFLSDAVSIKQIVSGLIKKKAAATDFNNIASVCALGHSHRSKLECAVCQVLQLRQRAGEIVIDQVEDHIYLTAARIRYVADFRCHYVKNGEPFHVEAKGYANPTWPLKKKLYKFYGPDCLEIWTGNWRSPVLTETIVPQKGNP